MRTIIRLPAAARNPVSLVGAALATAMAVLFLVLFLLQLLGYLTNPYMGLLVFISVPALFILGLLAIRHGIFDDPLGKRRVIVLAMLIGLASWIAAWWVLPKVPADITISGVRVPLRFGLGIINDQWLALTYIGAVTLLLARVPGAVRRLSFFGIAGRMALTNYIIQAALISWLAFGYGLSLDVRPYLVIVWTLALFSGLVLLSGIWLSKFPYGPFEWAWRTLSGYSR